MTWVKICATTNLADAQASIAAGANALGFIFAPSTRQIDVAAAAKIITELPPEIEKIGVFVNEPPARLAGIAERAALTGIQLHGDEPAESLQDFRAALGKLKLIKTLQARELLASPEKLRPYLDTVGTIDAILLDSGSPTQRGGTGVPFAWEEAGSLAREIQQSVPLVIAGGLSPENVTEAIRIFSPFGVDVVSGVEREIGKKDAARLQSFVTAVRHAEPIAASIQR